MHLQYLTHKIIISTLVPIILVHMTIICISAYLIKVNTNLHLKKTFYFTLFIM